MKLYEQLISILHRNSYRDLTFYLNNVPIVSVHINSDRKVFIITNNMDEMNCFEFSYSDLKDVEEFRFQIENLIFGSEVAKLLDNAKAVTFKSLLLEGVVTEKKIKFEQLEFVDRKGSCDITKYKQYTFENDTGITPFTIAVIIIAFVHQFFA